eukprot:1172190-Amphidinium_carterae.1
MTDKIVASSQWPASTHDHRATIALSRLSWQRRLPLTGRSEGSCEWECGQQKEGCRRLEEALTCPSVSYPAIPDAHVVPVSGRCQIFTLTISLMSQCSVQRLAPNPRYPSPLALTTMRTSVVLQPRFYQALVSFRTVVLVTSWSSKKLCKTTKEPEAASASPAATGAAQDVDDKEGDEEARS